MAKAKMSAIDPAETILARAEKSHLVAPLAIAFHEQLGLWRLCRRKPCKRAHTCRGDALACAALRWKVARSLLAKIRQQRVAGRDAERLIRRSLGLWSESNGVVSELKPLLIRGLARGPLLQLVRENPDGTKTIVARQNLTEEQARKLQQRHKARRRLQHGGAQ